MRKVMVVTGAFATHTTKLYHYYVCPRSWSTGDMQYIAVNYFKELKYLGEVTQNIDWEFDEVSLSFHGLSNNSLSPEIINDLEKFKLLLKGNEHKLFILKPITNNSCFTENLTYKGKGAFTQSHRFFDSLGTFFDAHQNPQTEESSDPTTDFTASNDGIEIN